MKMTLEEIAFECSVTSTTLRTYLERAEFAPCRTRSIYLYNFTDEQLEHLKELIKNRVGAKRNTYKTWKEEEEWKHYIVVNATES